MHKSELPPYLRSASKVYNNNVSFKQYLLCHGGHLLQITRGTCCHFSVTKNYFFGCTATQGSHYAGENLLPRNEGGVFPRNEPRETSCLSSGDQGHLLHGIVPRCQCTVISTNALHVNTFLTPIHRRET